MKSTVKFGSMLLALVMVLGTVFASGCSLSKEFSYKSDLKELPIGVYIYSLDVAYNQAYSKAKELEEFDATNDKWFELEITDDDGNKEVAHKWIKDTAEKLCLKYLAVEQMLKDAGASPDSASLEAAASQSKEYWDVGQYASYGYISPMSKELEPYGISYDSFRYCTAEYSVNYSTLFRAYYDKGGSQEVSDDELAKYVNENYVDYSAFSVNLYESTTDEAGESKDVALSDAEIKKIKSQLDGYVKNIDGGKSYDDVISAYMTASGLTESPSQDHIEAMTDFSMGDELKAAVEKLGNGKATTVQVGEGDTAIIYFVYKRDIKSSSKGWLESESNRASALSAMKTKDFDKAIDDAAAKLKYEKSSAVNSYDPKMFFTPEEPTTAAPEETTAEDETSAEETTAAE